MNTEEVYRNLRKTTAEIQNYSFETKLDRDTNSKDSGISQMGDHQLEHFTLSSLTAITTGAGAPTNGINGHGLAFDRDDFCNGGSKTQSSTTTTTESNTPENTVRLDSIDGSNHKSHSSQRNTPTFTMADNGEIIFESMHNLS